MLWRTKYVHLVSEEAKRESEWLAESFIDSTYTVCGEELRLMTPRDLCVLDGFESPFVTYKELPTREDVAFFMWTMNAGNTGYGVFNAIRRGRCYARFTNEERDLALDVAEIELYLERAFVGLPKTPVKKEGEASSVLPPKPLNVHFMAPLLVDVAAVIGPIDPMSGRYLADIPIPRLMQYKKTINRDKGHETEVDADDEKRRSDCLEEVNHIIAARRSAK